MHWDFLLPKLTCSPRSGEVVSYVLHEYMRFTKYGLSLLIEQNGFEIKSISPCGGVYALLGQIFLSHLHERGVQKKLLNKLVNKLALWLDRRFPDTEDTLNWMCIAVCK